MAASDDGTRQRAKPVDLRDALARVAMDEGWAEDTSKVIADVAVRRWQSFARRHARRASFDDQVRDLAQGLRQRSPVDPIYTGPGDFSRLALRLAAVLRRRSD